MKANIKIYDNGGKSYDRYTIILTDTKTQGIFGEYDYECISVSQDLTVYSHHYCEDGDHLGMEVPFEKLPNKVKSKLKEEL